jgi:hypothetical protein
MEEKVRDPSLAEAIAETFSYVPSLDQAERLISSFETKNTVKFSCYKADKNFGREGKLIVKLK